MLGLLGILAVLLGILGILLAILLGVLGILLFILLLLLLLLLSIRSIRLALRWLRIKCIVESRHCVYDFYFLLICVSVLSVRIFTNLVCEFVANAATCNEICTGHI